MCVRVGGKQKKGKKLLDPFGVFKKKKIPSGCCGSVVEH